MVHNDELALQVVLIGALRQRLQSDGRTVHLFETHLSWVLVDQQYAYKFKKALRLPFVDYTTLEARHHYCKEELRLNRRFAPALYLGLTCVNGSAQHPCLDGHGSAIEYGVVMRAFAQDAIWTHRLAQGRLDTVQIDALAGVLARSHAAASPAPSGCAWGTAAAIGLRADANAGELAGLEADNAGDWSVAELLVWQQAQWSALGTTFGRRKARGKIRECHADLHCGNILTLGDTVSVFDCLEFSDSLRWIDVMDDIAFTCMDLNCRGRPDLAARLLNAYLEITGDYAGLRVARFHRVQHALVRCKVALLGAMQASRASGGRAGAGRTGDHAQGAHAARRYLQCARQDAHADADADGERAALLIMHGVSGSGKSCCARWLLAEIGAVQLRSDVERKRLAGLPASAGSACGPGQGRYAPAALAHTYRRLRRLACCVLGAGMPVIVDAAFLQHSERMAFARLARAYGCPFLILDMQADPSTLQARIAARAQRGGDPSEAGLDTLAWQLAAHEALDRDEETYALAFDPGWNGDAASRCATLARVRAALAVRATGSGCLPAPPGSPSSP